MKDAVKIEFNFDQTWKGIIMREAVVVASSRTPLAKSYRGSFNLTRPDELAAHAIKDVLAKDA